MTIAIAESLVRVGGVVPGDLLKSLADNYDPARGYGTRNASRARSLRAW